MKEKLTIKTHGVDIEYTIKEIRHIYKNKLSEAKDRLTELREAYYNLRPKDTKSEGGGWEKVFEEMRLERINEACNTIARWERKLTRLKDTEEGRGGRPEADLDELKRTYRIEDIISEKPARTTAKWKLYKCPVHNDKTPSFYWYSDNHGHCYGCGWHGSVIDLYMAVNGVDVGRAIREMAG